ncbi:bacteriorhodopsin [Halovenus sp. WSH3]|uniref:Bacteriorhodopsin n=1 Tax=Halovenus carboxidivorans TaxID=2692199 RepID=A0A6B0TB47_9EURY|nr:bacteriorhodopsin [Halovenus carboxidivorans]MXR52441.1 bacteriorhodopsin [Halovenus carboxidivorans]
MHWSVVDAFASTVLSVEFGTGAFGHTPGSEGAFLWIGTAGMFLGMLYFIATGWGVTDSRMKKFYIVTTMIAAIAFSNYLAMATGFGVVDLAPLLEGVDEKPIYWARYTDWILTTPLLLYDLALLAGADTEDIATLISLDVMMIITGVIATLAVSPVDILGLDADGHRVLWWGVSTGFFVVLVYFLFAGLSDKVSQLDSETQGTFNLLRYLILLLWSAYPVWWLIGSEGLGVVGLTIETAGFAVLDLTAKVGFGIILLRSHSILESSAAPSGEATTADD